MCEGIAKKGPFAPGLAFYQVVTDMWNVKGIGEKGVKGWIWPQEIPSSSFTCGKARGPAHAITLLLSRNKVQVG